MADIYKVISTNPVIIKSDASVTSTIVGALQTSDEITLISSSGSWFQCAAGWVYSLDSSGTISLFQKIGETDPTADTTTVPASGTVPAAALTQDQVNAKIAADASIALTNDVSYATQLSGLRVKSLKGIHGMPYQFMPIADTRMDTGTDALGRKYAEMIVSKMPLLLMTPGDPVFLSSYSDSEKKGFIEYALNLAGGVKDSQSDLDALLSREGRYYTLKPNYVEYFNHVNPMCRAAANFLGIADTVIGGDGISLDSYNWQNNTNSDLHTVLNYKGSSAFYIHSETQISESFSNSTTESMLASKANQLSDMGREINFLMGGASAAAGVAVDKTVQSSLGINNAQNTADLTKGLLGSTGFMKSITGGLQTVFAGGKLTFPEIWSDSHYSTDYSIQIKLTTPDCDKLSWYLNICVPLMHLIGFASPKQAGVNGYLSPFLIRAFYKGLFNCDMGIITSMSVNKGAEGSWTKDGLPTVMDINFTLKDLYSTMAITTNKNIKNGLMNNIALMDYMANLCGVNINEPDIQRVISMYYTQNFKNKITDTVRLDIAGGLDQWWTNKILSLYKSN